MKIEIINVPGQGECVQIDGRDVAYMTPGGWCSEDVQYWDLVVAFLRLQAPGHLIERNEPISDSCECGNWWCPVCSKGSA